jgi:hypothetical protein
MLNPWLAFSIRATRLGWETQSMVVDQLMAMAGVNAADRRTTSDVCPTDAPEPDPAAVAPRPLAEAQAFAQPPTETPIHAMQDATPSKVAQQVSNGHKKHGRAGKRRRSK